MDDPLPFRADLIMSTIEPLETRIAPAVTIVNAHTATYTDQDGDLVTIKVSKGDFHAGASFTTTLGVSGDQLLDILLTGPGFSGTNLTVTVRKAGGGDGLANVGFINASGIDLGKVTIPGDLGEIAAGDTTTVHDPGVVSLEVRSFGAMGTTTGALTNGDGTAESHIVGALGSLKVKGDMLGAWLHVTGAGAGDELNGSIGAITIGGSLSGSTTRLSGSIDITGNIGAVKIAHDIAGGTGESSGALQSDYGKIKSVTLGGGLVGGSATYAGEIRSGSNLGPVVIHGNVTGGAGDVTGFIASDTGFGVDHGNIASLTIDGSLIGGAGGQTGLIRSSVNLGLVKIGGSVTGGTGSDSGEIIAENIGAVSIHGSLAGTETNPGGFHLHSGALESHGKIGVLKINGDVKGGVLSESGFIHSAGSLAKLIIHGSVLGGAGGGGSINVDGPLPGGVKIGGMMTAHDFGSGLFIGLGSTPTAGKVGKVTIGSLAGDDITHPVFIEINSNSLVAGIAIKGDVDHGVFSTFTTPTFSIGGSMHTGVVELIGVRTLTIGGDFGSSDLGGAAISVQGHADTNSSASTAIQKLTIGGNVLDASIGAGYSGLDDNPDARIGTVKVKGNWTASTLTAGVLPGSDADYGTDDDIPIPQTGEPDQFFSKIGKIIINGQVEGSAASGDHFGFVAQEIGSMRVHGVAVKLTHGHSNDTSTSDPDLMLGTTGDVTVHEV